MWKGEWVHFESTLVCARSSVLLKATASASLMIASASSPSSAASASATSSSASAARRRCSRLAKRRHVAMLFCGSVLARHTAAASAAAQWLTLARDAVKEAHV